MLDRGRCTAYSTKPNSFSSVFSNAKHVGEAAPQPRSSAHNDDSLCRYSSTPSTSSPVYNLGSLQHKSFIPKVPEPAPSNSLATRSNAPLIPPVHTSLLRAWRKSPDCDLVVLLEERVRAKEPVIKRSQRGGISTSTIGNPCVRVRAHTHNPPPPFSLVFTWEEAGA